MKRAFLLTVSMVLIGLELAWAWSTARIAAILAVFCRPK